MTDIPTLVADKVAEQVLRSVSLDALLAELTRRQRTRPNTGIPKRVAETLVDMYLEEEKTNAVLLVARLAEVAITWQDRESIEARLGARFDEEQWARFALQLEDFDEWDSVVDDGRVGDFLDRCLDRARLVLDETGPDSVIVDRR